MQGVGISGSAGGRLPRRPCVHRSRAVCVRGVQAVTGLSRWRSHTGVVMVWVCVLWRAR